MQIHELYKHMNYTIYELYKSMNYIDIWIT